LSDMKICPPPSSPREVDFSLTCLFFVPKQKKRPIPIVCVDVDGDVAVLLVCYLICGVGG
jgi:hypothetical protein